MANSQWQDIMQAFFARKSPVILDPVCYREIGVKIFNPASPGKGPSLIYLVINDKSTVAHLKSTLSVEMKIEPTDMLLLFCGEPLDDTEVVPDDAYEELERGSFEESLFHPNVCLHVIVREELFELETDYIGPYEPSFKRIRHGGIDATEDNIDEQEAQLEAARKLAETRQKELDKAEFLAKDLEIFRASRTIFNLSNELDKVGCLRHHSRLVDTGYSDEGAFYSLTENILAGEGFWIPKKDRNRMLALGKQLRIRAAKQIEVLERSRHKSTGAREESSSNLLDDDEVGHGKGTTECPTIPPSDSATDSKSDNLAKENRNNREMKGGIPMKKNMKDFLDPATHATALQVKIDAIRRNMELDKQGFLKNYQVPQGKSSLCCARHKKALADHHTQYAKLRCSNIETEIRLIVAAADAALYRNGFLPRGVLRRIAIEQLDLNKKNINRFTHRTPVLVPIAAAVSMPRAAATAIRVTAVSALQVGVEVGVIGDAPQLIPAIAINQLDVPSTDDSAEANLDDPRGQERAAVEALLNRCLMGTLELSASLSWAGELERRKLCYGDPMRSTSKGSNTNSRDRPAVKVKVMSDSVSLPNGNMMFYSTKMFCKLLLIMIQEKTDRNCSMDEERD